LGTAAHLAALPPPGSPAARHVVWAVALPDADRVARARDLADALGRARARLPTAVRDETGRAVDEVLAGVLPGLLAAVGVVAAGAALGGAAGAALGALVGGAGALPGAAAGAGLGAQAGVVALEWLGLGFLVVHVGGSLGEAAGEAAHGVRGAWAAADRAPGLRDAALDAAARDLARAAAIVVRGVLEGVVAFLVARGVAGAAARVPELVSQLRASRLGAGFATWVERNWAGLVADPRLRTPPTAREAPGAVSSGSPPPGTAASAARAAPPALAATGAGTRAGTRAGTPSASRTADAVPADPPTAPAAAAARPIFAPKPPPGTIEPGAVRGPFRKVLHEPPPLPEGWPATYDLSTPRAAAALNSFGRPPVPDVLPPGTRLYRIVDADSNPAGGFWSLDPPPATEAQWRAGWAVQGQWNGDGAYVEHVVGPGGLRVWRGPAAPQAAAADAWHLPGGREQIFVPPNTVAPSAPRRTPWNP
jgi:hypothetical protein